jgi:hypothetical protein
VREISLADVLAPERRHEEGGGEDREG